MTSPSENIKIKCPQCKTVYKDWYRPSINLDLENFDPEYIKEATTATCPRCKTTIELDCLIVEGGIFYIRDEE